jgi:hypothetical protein
MSNRSKIFTIVLALLVLHLSCTTLPQKQAPKEGDVAIEILTQTNSIPADWGKLISVVNQLDSPSNVQLWFQGEKGDVHFVIYDVNHNRLSQNARLIPQK